MNKHELRILLKMKIEYQEDLINTISEHKIGPDEYDSLVRAMERKDTLKEIVELLERNKII